MIAKLIAASAICMATSLSVFAQQNDGDMDTNVATGRERGKPKLKYAPSVVSLAPIQFSENGVVGVGVSYERALDKAGIIAAYCPASIVWNNNSENRLGAGYIYYDPMFYVMPGVKIYPTGNQGVTKYAIGPSLVLATGQRTESTNYYYSPYSTPSVETKTHSIFGMMVNQSININPTEHLYIGSEFGFGFSYLNYMNGEAQSMTGLVQFSFKIGYRY